MKLGRNVLVLSSTVFFILVALFSWYYLFPLYLKELGATESQIGLLYTLFTLSFTLLQLVGGVLSDRIGRKKCIVWPTYVYALALFFTAMSGNWLGASIFYLAGNLASAVQMPSFTAMVSESTERKGQAFSIFETFVAFGLATGPLVGGLLLPFISIRGLIFVTSLVVLLSGFIRHLLLEERNFSKESGTRFSLSGPFPKPYMIFLLAGSLMYLIFSLTSNGPFLTLFGSEMLGLKKSTINFYFAAGTYIGALSSLIFSDLPVIVGARRILGLCFFAIPTFVILWSHTGHPLFFFLALPFVHWAYITYQIVLTDLSPSDRRGTGIGLFGTITGLVGSAGPFVGMRFKLHLGPRAPFYLALVLGIAAIPFLLRSEKTTPPPSQAGPSH